MVLHHYVLHCSITLHICIRMHFVKGVPRVDGNRRYSNMSNLARFSNIYNTNFEFIVLGLVTNKFVF